mmetsp:Transcript_8911/g.21918  ORF Transcript_8911/g.21918 Transcript_8911/m.21918 type:complete len:469 (+) Transcript_8911:1319-2725(+)
MRLGVESIELRKLSVIRNEASPGRTVLRAPAQDRAREVVRLGPHMEHEEERTAGYEHVEDLPGRLPHAAFDPDRADNRQCQQDAHRADPVADGVDSNERFWQGEVEGGDEDALVAEGVEAPHCQEGRDVEPDAAVEEGEELKEINRSTYAEHIPRQGLHRVTAAELALELVELLEADVAALPALDVLFEGDVPAPQDGVKPSEDVLRQVDALGGLRDAAPGHVEDLVEEVGVAVVQAHLQGVVEHPLAERDEAPLLEGHVVGDRAQAAGEDVLAETDDRGRLPAVVLVELLEQVPHLDRLLEVALLVHVDRLDEFPAGEDDGVVLILRLPLADDRVPGELDPVHVLDPRPPLAVVALLPLVVGVGVHLRHRLGGAALQLHHLLVVLVRAPARRGAQPLVPARRFDQAGVVATAGLAVLPLILLVVDVRDPQVRELLQQELDVVRLGVELFLLPAVDLAGDDVLVLQAG